MIFAHDSAAIGARHRADAALNKCARGFAGVLGAATEPNHRPLCRAQHVCQHIERSCIRDDSVLERPANPNRRADHHALHIDRYFEAHRSGGALSAADMAA